MEFTEALKPFFNPTFSRSQLAQGWDAQEASHALSGLAASRALSWCLSLLRAWAPQVEWSAREF